MRVTAPEAIADLASILRDTRSNYGADAAIRMFRSVRRSFRIVETYPFLGRAGRVEGTREHPIPRTPFIVIYQPQPDAVRIVRVIHGAMQWPPAP